MVGRGQQHHKGGHQGGYQGNRGGYHGGNNPTRGGYGGQQYQNEVQPREDIKEGVAHVAGEDVCLLEGATVGMVPLSVTIVEKPITTTLTAFCRVGLVAIAATSFMTAI
jgi:hypothetical protein